MPQNIIVHLVSIKILKFCKTHVTVVLGEEKADGVVRLLAWRSTWEQSDVNDERRDATRRDN